MGGKGDLLLDLRWFPLQRQRFCKEKQHLPEMASFRVWVNASENLPLSTLRQQHADNTANLFSEHPISQTRCR